MDFASATRVAENRTRWKETVWKSSVVPQRPYMDATERRTTQNSCNVCFKTFNRKFALKRHLATHNQVPRLKCDICDIQFGETYDLNTHIKTKHHLQSLACKSCPRKFTSRSELLVHMKTHTGLLHKCTSCHKSFASRSRLERHMVSHSKSHAFACDGCGTKFKYKSSLNRHGCRDNHHVCATCRKDFKTRQGVISHQKVHDEATFFQCAKCGKKFQWRWSHTRHIRKCEMLAA